MKTHIQTFLLSSFSKIMRTNSNIKWIPSNLEARRINKFYYANQINFSRKFDFLALIEATEIDSLKFERKVSRRNRGWKVLNKRRFSKKMYSKISLFSKCGQNPWNQPLKELIVISCSCLVCNFNKNYTSVNKVIFRESLSGYLLAMSYNLSHDIA